MPVSISDNTARRKMAVLTEGYTNPHTAKTARNVLFYIPEQVVALIDKFEAGKSSAELLNAGSVPIAASLDDVPDANTLLIGVATPGGKIPVEWRPIILNAISRGMNIISGLHDYLSDDAEFAAAAEKYQVALDDVRKNSEKTVTSREGINEQCLRVHTVGNDCSLGKMIVSMEVHKELLRRGADSVFVPTGQTSIIIEGHGTPVDSVVGDYINGSAEQLVLKHQDHDIMLIEGQGSLVHPRYSAVTLGLLHGCQPHGLIMCYEIGRKVIHGVESFPIPPLHKVMEWYEAMANIMHPAEFIGVAMNGRKVSAREAEKERAVVKERFGLPACDVFRHGAGELADAVIAYRERTIDGPTA